MTDKSIIIVGAGLSGLATGCYGQMNGYKTRIFEYHTKSGGVCTSWKRKGYTFDYALHNLFGIIPGSADNKVWKELNALQGLTTLSFSEFVQVEDTNGKKLTIHTSLAELEKHLVSLAPDDEKKIKEFIKACRRIGGYDIFGAMSGGLSATIKLLPVLGLLTKYGKMTLEDYAKGFSDPFLRKAFPTIQYDIPSVPVIIPMVFLAAFNKGDGGWPIGGSLALSKNVEKYYLELGGQINYNSRVLKILTENNKALGIQLEDGSQYFADIIVSAADGYSTIFNMLEGKCASDSIRTYYDSYPKTIPFGFEVYYGLSRDLSGEPHALVLFQEAPIEVEGREHDRLNVEIFNFDPSFAAAGKAVIKVVMESNYDYWQQLSKDIKSYNEAKRKIADAIAERLERRFPGFTKQIEVIDVVTPVSVMHFTDAFRGSCVPWPAPEAISREVSKNGVSKTLLGLESFYMVGQWAGALYSTTQVCQMGRDLIQRLCKKDHKEFLTTQPS